MRPKLRAIAITFMLTLILLQPVSAGSRETVRQAGLAYAKPLETIMVDGPFYVENRTYYVADYVKPDSTIAASLVYDEAKAGFVGDSEVIRKVLATKDLKKLTIADPLFFALGNPEQLVQASRFEIQNVRNFASYSSITDEERRILEVFLADYEDVMGDVAEVSRVTQGILYPGGALEITYLANPAALQITLDPGFRGGRFSYEGFQKLVEAYEKVEHDYKRLSADLAAFAGGLPEYPAGAVIREKWEVQVTKESILEEVRLIDENGQRIRDDVKLRRDILEHPYEVQITVARERLGYRAGGRGFLTAVASAVKRLARLLLGLFGLAVALLALRRRGPGRGAMLLLLAMLLLTPLTLASSYDEVPSMSELISQKIGANETIPYVNHAKLLNDTVVEELLKGFRLLLKGESVEVRGPYLYYGKPYYFFDIKRDGVSTGNGFLLDAERYRLVGDQRQVYQLLKTLLFSELLKTAPLYASAEPKAVQQHAIETLQSPLDIFLTNLSVNMEEGRRLEERLTEEPDFELLLNLTSHYVTAYVLLQNIRQLVPEEEAERLTAGFSREVYLLDAYSRAARGLSAQEFLQGRAAQYRGRTLNRLPLIQSLSAMGLRPSKAQVAHDLTSDLIHDNPYLWRLGSIENPNLFARLAYREGTYTVPKSIANRTAG